MARTAVFKSFVNFESKQSNVTLKINKIMNFVKNKQNNEFCKK